MHRPLAAVVLLAATALAQPSILRLPAAADASADADQPAVNFGSSLIVTSGKTFTSTPTFRTWMTRGHYQFDLAPLMGLPAPTRARLRVYQEQSNAAGCLDVTVHRVTQAWSESTLTWQNKPTHDPAVLATQCVGDSFDLGVKNFDVTTAVLAWLSNTPNFGLVIRDPTESAAGAARPLHATSREGTDPLRHPVLEVAWNTGPFGTGCGPSPRVPTLDLDSGEPAIGRAYTLLAADFASGAAIIHLLGLSNTTWNGAPLPINLAFLNYPACNLLVAPDLQVPGAANSRGRATLTFSVPNAPSLRGRSFFHQTFGVDANLVLAFTNGFEARVF
jgi:hypothetical protein